MQIFPNPGQTYGYERLWVANGESGRPQIYFQGKPLSLSSTESSCLKFEVDFEGEPKTETLETYVTISGQMIITYRTPAWCPRGEMMGWMETTVCCYNWSAEQPGFQINQPNWTNGSPGIFVVAMRIALGFFALVTLGLVILVLGTLAGFFR